MTTTRARDGEPAYTGALGTTREEQVFLTGADGVARRVGVIRTVNAQTDPALALAAIAGTLHRMDDGVDLAVPYVFHDPGARRFFLVVPRARGHEELTLRAELLVRLAGEPGAALPAYVRDLRSVVGAEGLRRAIEEGGDPRVTEVRSELVAAREERLRERAEEVTRREDELRQRGEELEAERADVGVREHELEQRFAEVVAREETLASEERALRANVSALQGRERLSENRARDLDARERDLNARERDLDRRERDLDRGERDLDVRDAELATRESELATRESELAAREAHAPDAADLGTPAAAVAETPAETAAADLADDLEPLEVDELEPAEAEPLEAGELEDDAAVATVPEPTHSLSGEVVTPAARDAVAAPDAAPVSEVPPEPAVASAEPEPEELLPEELDAVPAQPLAPEVPPSWVKNGHGAYAAVVEGEVRLWASGRPESAARLAAGGAVLLLQADPDSALPLAVLSVLGEGEPFARAVLDITRPDDRAVLESLARDFRVRLEVVSGGGRALGSYAVGAQGEANAQRVLAVLVARDAGSDEARRAASERLREAGVASTEGEAFERTFRDEASLASAAGTESAARVYEPLLDPAVRERVVLARGVLAAGIDPLGKRVILAALRCGVALSPRMVLHAQTTGVAVDERALVARALAAYARTCEAGPEAVGRGRTEALRAWDPLLAWAERLGVAVPETVYAQMRGLFDVEDPSAQPPPDPRTAPSADAIGSMSDDELERWADHPRARFMLAQEMLRRDAARFGPRLSRALRLLPLDEAVNLAAEMVRAGDALSDAWVELLASRRPRVPAMACVATAVIHLRRGLTTVLHHALSRDEPSWKLYAWAAGEFGAGVVRAAGRVEGFDAEHMAWVLAHAVRAGAGRDVEKVRAGAAGPLADAAARAIGTVDDARAYDAALRQGPGESEDEQVAHRLLAKVGTRGNESLSTGAPEGV